ncbi:MarR family winged helix-turn-helix transcriptional regulator [Aliamphritea ceti]|uniref:MarR family winged helix-turn-helix transcriptional regulator n=1 Tax=Aliamphritea ceti TaxID=1524258 RepID=UPI0021C2982D|nr:MarR family transcriptional regulator [Aliamphritea ceti]
MKHTAEGHLLTSIILQTFKLNGLLVLEGDQLVKDVGLTSARWKVLGALSSGPGSMTVPDIARIMGQSRQAVQRLSNEMVKDGLLVTQPNPDHQRAKLLTLTEAGVDAYAQAMEKQIPWVNSLASDLTEADLEQVSVVLQKLMGRLEK